MSASIQRFSSRRENQVFIHGKAGVVELADGTLTSFLGSIPTMRITRRTSLSE